MEQHCNWLNEFSVSVMTKHPHEMTCERASDDLEKLIDIRTKHTVD